MLKVFFILQPFPLISSVVSSITHRQLRHSKFKSTHCRTHDAIFQSEPSPPPRKKELQQLGLFEIYLIICIVFSEVIISWSRKQKVSDCLKLKIFVWRPFHANENIYSIAVRSKNCIQMHVSALKQNVTESENRLLYCCRTPKKVGSSTELVDASLASIYKWCRKTCHQSIMPVSGNSSEKYESVQDAGTIR